MSEEQEGLMTRRDEMVERLKQLMIVELNGNFYQVCQTDAVSDFILSEQAKAVAEVVEPLKSVELDDRDCHANFYRLEDAREKALSKAREYTGE